MSGLVSRSRDVATPAERGDDDRPFGEEPAIPSELRHEVVRQEPRAGPAFDQCVHCKLSRSLGSIDPYSRCPAREPESAVDRRAEAADADAAQADLASASALARTDGGRSP